MDFREPSESELRLLNFAFSAFHEVVRLVELLDRGKAKDRARMIGKEIGVGPARYDGATDGRLVPPSAVRRVTRCNAPE